MKGSGLQADPRSKASQCPYKRSQESNETLLQHVRAFPTPSELIACNSPKRMIVLQDIYPDFVTELVNDFAGYAPGDPMAEGTTLAPLSTKVAAQ